MAEVITVSALNHYVKMLLDANDRLFDIALRGEIANFVQNARSGHCYFSLRDEASSVKAVMSVQMPAVLPSARKRGCALWYAAVRPFMSVTVPFSCM